MYRPHDVITGIVELTTTKPVVLPQEYVFIHLICESSVHLRIKYTATFATGPHGEPGMIQEYEHFRHDAILLDEGRPLSKQETVLHPGQIGKFEFTFQVPEKTNRPCLQQFRGSGASHFWTLQQHDLPPSYPLGKPLKTGLDKFSIEYSLGVAVRPQFNTSVSIAQRKPILLSPLSPYTKLTNPEWNVSKDSFQIKTSQLKEPPNTHLSLQQRIWDKMSSNTPHADFLVIVELPTQITAGSDFSFKAAISIQKRSEPGLCFPPIAFQVDHIRLRVIYYARALRDWDAFWDRKGRRHRNKVALFPRFTKDSRKGELACRYPEPKPGMELSVVPRVLVARLPMMPAVETQGNECEAWFSARLPSNLQGFKLDYIDV
ncbi:hypothetical protein VP1G_06233 [Cytospora mali]|uniref:Arrestin-like N-terminal domain-containing protein n=1 Tax=Cytospora mali TaxID=578113 RepID=A0A194V4V8_CYTMA|nr:hypothetical protein VP1G_06233 [Valsa mali var. pyri (nom. inval.)]